MSRNRVEVIVGYNRFFILKLSPFASLEMLGTLQKSFLGPLVEVMKGMSSSDASGAQYAGALKSLSENLDGKQMVKLAKLMLDPEQVSVQPPEAESPVKLTEGQVNLCITGVDELLALCMEVIKVNYADFGKRATALFGEARAAMAEQNSSIH